MKVDEVLEKRIQRVRLPSWATEAYIKIHFLEDGTCSPWVYLVSPRIQQMLHMEVGSPQLLLYEAFGDDDLWEVYKGPPYSGF